MKKAVVAWTQHIADSYRQVFQLTDWDAYGLSSPASGKFYDCIVMVRPHWQMSAAEFKQFEAQIQHWRARLPSTKSVQVI